MVKVRVFGAVEPCYIFVATTAAVVIISAGDDEVLFSSTGRTAIKSEKRDMNRNVTPNRINECYFSFIYLLSHKLLNLCKSKTSSLNYSTKLILSQHNFKSTTYFLFSTEYSQSHTHTYRRLKLHFLMYIMCTNNTDLF